MLFRYFTHKRALYVSIIINLLLFGLTIHFVRGKGGVEWIKHQMGFQSTDTIPRITSDPSWQNRKSVFDAQPVHSGAIIFAGDSMTDFCPWDEMLPGRDILNRGLPGDYVEGVSLRLDEILRHTPRQLFVMVGINDLLADRRSTDYIVDKYKSIVERVQKSSPTTEIHILSVLPINHNLAPYLPPVNPEVVELNGKLEQLALSKKAKYLELYSLFVDGNGQLKTEFSVEGLHLNGRGCLKWAETVSPYLK